MESPREKIDRARECLEAARDALTREINAYPTPVSGCDVQYNHLLGERQKVSKALAALSANVFVPTPRQPSAHDPVEQR